MTPSNNYRCFHCPVSLSIPVVSVLYITCSKPLVYVYERMSEWLNKPFCNVHLALSNKLTKPCKNCQSQVTWNVKFKCQFSPVPSRPVHHDHHGGCTQGRRRLWISYKLPLACVRKLEVIWPDPRPMLRRSLWFDQTVSYSVRQSHMWKKSCSGS